MHGIAFPLAALAFAATTPDLVTAQCYGPECNFRQPNAPAYHSERPDFHSYPSNGQPYRSAPYEQAQPYRPAPHQGQTTYQSAPYHQGQPYQPMPQSQPAYQRPAYQMQSRPPAGYSNVPPGMAPGVAPRGPNYHPAYSHSRMDTRTRVTKISEPARPVVRQQPVSNSRTVVKSAPRPAGAGQVTISATEYRNLQNQARELQRLRSTGLGAPNRPSPFPQVPPPPAGNTPAL